MPTRPPSACAEPGCPTLTHTARCPRHTTTHRNSYRNPATERIYNSRRWRTLSKQYLATHPTCQTPGCTTPSHDVDHITPLTAGGAPWDPANWQALCRPCHGAKTAHEVGLGHR